jgi:hypothetical protein
LALWRHVVKVMDEQTRRDIMDRAKALLDPDRVAQQEAEHEAWRAEREGDLLDQETDELLARSRSATIKQKRFDPDELIFKTVINESAPTQASAMSPDLQRQWNEWADSRIRDVAEMTARAIGEEVGKVERGLKADIDRQFAELFAAVAQLRLEVEALRAKKGKKPNAA